MRSQHGITAAIDKPKDVVVCDFLAETDAARAEDAALVIKCDPRPEHNILGFLDFVLEKTRFGVAEIHTEFLQTAFAGLIANRAIERMINKEEFHHTELTFLYDRRVGANRHAFGHILSAGNLRTGYPVGDRFAVGAELRLAIGAKPREAHFDQAHSAIARRTELLVVAVARHENANLRARFDHARAFRKLMPDAINLDVEQ